MLKSKFQTNITFAYTVYCILFTSANFLTQNVIYTGIDSNFRLQYFLSLWSWVWAAERPKMKTLQNQCKLYFNKPKMYNQQSLQFNQTFNIPTNVSKCFTNKKS